MGSLCLRACSCCLHSGYGLRNLEFRFEQGVGAANLCKGSAATIALQESQPGSFHTKLGLSGAGYSMRKLLAAVNLQDCLSIVGQSRAQTRERSLVLH